MSVNGQDSGDVLDQALVPVPPQVEEPPREMRVAEVVEPEERLMPLRVPGSSAQTPEGSVPVLHLHRHVHAGVVDDQARAIIERLAARHGEVFTFLNKEITRLSESELQRKQFEADLVAWVEAVRGVLESQGSRTASMGNELAELRSAIRAVSEQVQKVVEDFTLHRSSVLSKLDVLSVSVNEEMGRLWEQGRQETRLKGKSAEGALFAVTGEHHPSV